METSKLNSNLFKQYRNQLIQIGVSENTIKRKLASLRKFSGWLTHEGYLKKDPLAPRKKWLPHPLYHPRMAFQAQRALPYFTYLNFLILVVFLSALGIGLYQQFVVRAPSELAYPAGEVGPKRYLSFQGRLTDSNYTPIVTAVNMEFKLYDEAGTGSPPSGGTLLWDTGATPCSVDPDQDGIFALLLGTTTGDGYTCSTATEIPASVFSENAGVWLETKVVDETLSPRIQIATVGYALNAETLQGFPLASATSATPEATMGALARTVPAINPAGNLVIASDSPTIWSTSGTFGIKGQAISIQTDTGTGGNITLAPDGTGVLNIVPTSGNQIGGTINATNSALTTGALYTGRVENNNTGFDFLRFFGGTSPVKRFSVGALGSIDMENNLDVGGAATITGTLAANGSIISNLVPSGTRDLGSSGSNWDYLYINNLDAFTLQGAISGNDQSINNLATLQANTIEDNDDTTLSVNDNLSVIGNVVPSAGNTYDLGSSGAYWNNLYVNNIYGGSSGTSGYWTKGSGLIYPNNTYESVAVGGIATSSAKLYFEGTTGNASMSGQLTLHAAGTNYINALSGQALSLRTSVGGDAGLLDRMTITNAGNVGIGTTNPSQKLEVASGNILLSDTSNGSVKLSYGGQLVDESSRTLVFANNDSFDVITENGSGHMFEVRSTAYNFYLSNVVKVNIDSSGNLGIEGALSDLSDATLSINDNLSVVGNILPSTGNTYDLGSSSLRWNNVYANNIYGTSTGTQGFWTKTDGLVYPNNAYESVAVGGIATSSAKLYFEGTTGNASMSGQLTLHVAGTNYINALSGQALSLRTSVGGDAGLTDKLYISNSGNVGIGTTTPSEKLDVSGNASVSGNLTLYGGARTITGTQMNALTIGGSTTGGITIDSGTGSITLSDNTDVSDSDITSIDKLEGYDAGLYIDMGQDSQIIISSDGAGTPFASPDIDITGSVYFDDHLGLASGKQIQFADTGEYIVSDGTNLTIASGGDIILDPAVGETVTINDDLSVTKYATVGASLALGTANAPAGPGNLATSGTASFNSGGVTIDSSNYVTAARFIDSAGGGAYFLDPAAAASLNIAGYATTAASLAVGYSSVPIGPGNAVFSGNVGIGTTGPASTLHLQGTSQTVANFDTTGSRAGQIQVDGGSVAVGSGGGILFGAYDDVFAGIRGYIQDASNYGIGSLIVGTRNATTDTTLTERIRITSAGYVGIGTTNPLEKLDIAGNATMSGTLTLGQGQTLRPAFGPLQLAYKSGANAWTTGLVMTESGNVGIGTTAPGAKLEVSGSADTALRINSTGGVGNNPRLEFWNSTSGSPREEWEISTNSENLFFYNNPGADDVFKIMGGSTVGNTLVLENGRVGIGTSAPDEELHLENGQFKMRDSAGGRFYSYRNDTAIALNEVLVSYHGYGEDSDTGVVEGARITMRAGAAWSAGSAATEITFFTTPSGGTSPVESFSITESGRLWNNNTFTSAGTAGLCWDGTGTSYVNDCSSTPGDIAEYYGSPLDSEPGDILSMDYSQTLMFKKSDKVYDQNIIGIISTNPSGPLGKVMGEETIPQEKNPQPMALTGRVPLKVNLENGPIKIGDSLTASSQPGVAMKATRAGRIIGQALENYDGSVQISKEVENVHADLLENIRDGYSSELDHKEITEEELEEIIRQKAPEVLPPIPPENVGKIMVFADVGWYDPDVYLTDTGELQISTDSTNNYQLTNGNTIIDRVGTFGQAVIAQLKTGLIQTQELFAEKKIVSPVVETNQLTANKVTSDQLTVNSLEAEESEFGKLLIKSEQGETVASIDNSGNASFGGLLATESLQVEENATIAGTLYAQEIVTEKGTFGDLLARVENLENSESQNTQSVSEPESQSVGESDSLISSDFSETPSSSESSDLAEASESWPISDPSNDIPMTNNQLLITSTLTVLGNSSLSDTSIAGQLMVDATVIIDKEGIQTLPGSNLKLQAYGWGGIDMLDGKVTINTEGDVLITGELTAGRINTGGLVLNESLVGEEEATASGFGKLLAVINREGKEVASIDTSGSAFFAQLGIKADYTATQSGTIIAAAENYAENGYLAPAIKTNATAGIGILPANESEVMIYNPQITDESLIYVTATTNTENKVLYVKAKKAAVSQTEPGWFIVALNESIAQDVQFNWWIIGGKN